MPSDADRASLANCDADALYYGIDMKVDYPRARQCAYGGKPAEGSPGADRPEILMMIYANGLGVPPNYDLAIRFACQARGAPIERDGRVFRLWAVRAGERPAAPLDQCDDATSGLFTGYCSALQERQAAVARKARWQTVVAAMPGPQLSALRRAADTYFEARTDKEVNQSGSLRASMSIHERARLEDDFVQQLEQVRAPDFAPNAADGKAIESEIAALLKQIQTCDGYKPKWLAYRKAFVALALAQHKNSDANLWLAWLAAPRLAQLKELASGC
jgi:hypothetical protein